MKTLNIFFCNQRTFSQACQVYSICDRIMNTLLGDDYAGAGAAGPTPAAAVADFD
jgi:hypothetical protein